MSKRRKKKTIRPLYLSSGPLPAQLAAQFVGHRLIFSDASQKRQGGLAAVLFADSESLPEIATRSVPVVGSNELELQAVLFGLEQVANKYPGELAALFSDNRDAVDRLIRARQHGLDGDPALAGMLMAQGMACLPAETHFFWIRSHATCLGNALADFHAGQAAS